MPATYTLVDTDTPPNTLDSGSIASGAAATIVAPAATVLINGIQFDTVASGDAIDLPVVNSGTNPVGSEQSGEWVIGNSTVTINGTQVGDIPATDSLPIAVELDGNPSGTWNAGTQTWEVTGPVIAYATVTVNTAPFGTAPSGGTFDVPVKNTSGVEVGSKIANDYIIANNQISYNGSFVDSISAEQALLLIGRLDGVQGGTYNSATNTIDFTTPVPPIHPITSAYLTSVGISNDGTVYFSATFQQRTGAQLWQMFNTYILTGVADGWLTSLDTFYFPRWGSATANKWNVMNPIDSDSAFRMIFNGGWSHTPAGAKGNAVNTFGNTKYDFVTQGVNIRNFTVAHYTNDEGSVGIDSGIDTPNGFYFTSYNNTTYDSRFFPFSVNSNKITTNPMGLLIGVSSAATVDLIRNGVTLNSLPNVSVAFKAGEDYMGALNRGGALLLHTNRRYSGRWTWRRALTASEVSSFNRATQILMTDMGIQA